MTTKRQIKKLLDQVASRHSDLVVKGPYLVLRPQRHVLRSISIDRTWRADLPRFYWHIGHAFNPSGTLQGLAREIFWVSEGGPRYWSDADFTEVFIGKSEQSILPMLRRVQTIEDMFHVEGEPRSAEYDSWLTFNPFRIAMSAALGHWEAALAVYEKTKNGPSRLGSGGLTKRRSSSALWSPPGTAPPSSRFSTNGKTSSSHATDLRTSTNARLFRSSNSDMQRL